VAYTFEQLKALWVQAGGNPAASAVAAAVALAESGGRPDAFNGNGGRSQDRGLWQINSVHGAQSTFDPLGNARAAIAISNNGSNWKPWCVAWTDGACGSKGGKFDVTGSSPAGKRLSGNGGGSVPPGGSSPPPNDTGGVQQVSTGPLSADFWNGLADNFVGGILKLANHALFGMAVVFGSVSVMIGLIMMFRETSNGVSGALAAAGTAYRTVAVAPVKWIRK
jgi:hypothetical protein